jgi:aminoglycoside phosphotransferase (APT) family kinase protein
MTGTLSWAGASRAELRGRQLNPQRRFPGLQTLEWVARAVAPGARVVGGRRLQGGITSSMHRLAVESRRGTRTQVVLRRWAPGGEDSLADASHWFEREGHLLRALESTDIPAPRLLAVDPTGVSAGVPALLMTRVPGRMDLTPRDTKPWVGEIARMAVRIHELDLVADQESWQRREVPLPTWASRPADWRAAAAVLRGPVPAHDGRFMHGDYQHFNLLWRRGRLTGVVDWAGAGRGPADMDVGHCRLNLAVLYSAELAADFLAAYEAEAGRRVDRYWDLRCAVAPAFSDWAAFIPIQVGRRATFDAAGMHRRVDDLLAAALRRT